MLKLIFPLDVNLVYDSAKFEENLTSDNTHNISKAMHTQKNLHCKIINKPHRNMSCLHGSHLSEYQCGYCKLGQLGGYAFTPVKDGLHVTTKNLLESITFKLEL